MAVAGGADLTRLSLLGLDVPRANLLMNGDFRDAAFGTSFTAPANTSQTLTNWYVLVAGAGAIDVAQVTAGVPLGAYAAWRATVTATNNLKFGLVGFLTSEDTAILAGGTASLAVTARTLAGSTLSFLRAAVLSWTGAADAEPTNVVSAWNAAGVMPTWAANYTLENVAQNMPLTSTYTTFRFPAITIDTPGVKNLAVFIWSDDMTTTAGDVLYVADVSLVAGPQPANIERRRRVVTADLINGAVSSAKIADATIVTADLADGAVTSAKIADATIATVDLADGSVTTAKILDATIVAGDLADGAVTSAKILDGTIATADVAADAISQHVSSGTPTGNTTTSTTAVDIDATNLSVTITPTVGTRLLVKVMGSVSNNTAGAYTVVGIKKDSGGNYEPWVMTSAVADAYCAFGGSDVYTATAGVSTTFRLRWRVSTGTATLQLAELVVVELRK